MDRVTFITVAANDYLTRRCALWFYFYPTQRKPIMRWFDWQDAQNILELCYHQNGGRYIPRKCVSNPANVPGLAVNHGR